MRLGLIPRALALACAVLLGTAQASAAIAHGEAHEHEAAHQVAEHHGTGHQHDEESADPAAAAAPSESHHAHQHQVVETGIKSRAGVSPALVTVVPSLQGVTIVSVDAVAPEERASPPPAFQAVAAARPRAPPAR